MPSRKKMIGAPRALIQRLNEVYWKKEFAPPHVGSKPLPVRRGFDPGDKRTPFIEDRLAYLKAYYYGYGAQYTDDFVTYADVILLRDGEDGFRRGRDISTLTLRPRPECFTPVAALNAHGRYAVDLFRRLGKQIRNPDGTWENNTAVRFLTWPTGGDEIEIQPAQYESQIATNLTLDWESGKLSGGQPDATLRNFFEPPVDGRLLPLSQSRLANTLGVAVMLRSADNRLLFTIRSDITAVMWGDRLHCSSSGVFKWEDLKWQNGVLSFSAIFDGMRREINEELKLPEDSYTLIPLALARELPRGGKPQLFFAANCKLRLEDIRELMLSAPDRYEWKDPADLDPDSKIRQALARPESIPVEEATVEEYFTYEGWMAFKLFEAYDERQAIFGL